MNKRLRTVKDGTVTTRGVIPHYDLDGIKLPVRVKTLAPSTINKYRPPETYGGRLVFVLPGGGDFVSKLTL